MFLVQYVMQYYPCVENGAQHVILPLQKCVYNYTEGEPNRGIIYQNGTSVINDNVVNILDYWVEQYDERCFIYLLDEGQNLNDVIFYTDVTVDLFNYRCGSIIVSPFVEVKHNLNNVRMYGQIKLAQETEADITFYPLSYLPYSDVTVTGFGNSMKLIKFDNNTVDLQKQLTSDNEVENVEYTDALKTITRDVVISVSGEINKQQRTLAVCITFENQEEPYYQATLEVLEQQLIDELNNLNQFKILYYGADIYGIKEGDIVPIEMTEDNTQVLVLSWYKLIVQQGQYDNCSYNEYIHQNLETSKYECVASCDDNQITVSEIICVSDSEEKLNQYYYDNEHYYYQYQIYTELQEGEQCEQGKVKIEIDDLTTYCVDYCPVGYDFDNTDVENPICNRQEMGANDFIIRKQATLPEVTQSQCLFFDITNKECLDTCNQTLTKPRQCQQVDCATLYKLTDNSTLCLDDCSVFGYEKDGSYICATDCDTDKNIQENIHVCALCLGTYDQPKMIADDGTCIDVNKSSFYKFQEQNGVLLRHQVENCDNYNEIIEEVLGTECRGDVEPVNPEEEEQEPEEQEPEEPEEGDTDESEESEQEQEEQEQEQEEQEPEQEQEQEEQEPEQEEQEPQEPEQEEQENEEQESEEQESEEQEETEEQESEEQEETEEQEGEEQETEEQDPTEEEEGTDVDTGDESDNTDDNTDDNDQPTEEEEQPIDDGGNQSNTGAIVGGVVAAVVVIIIIIVIVVIVVKRNKKKQQQQVQMTQPEEQLAQEDKVENKEDEQQGEEKKEDEQQEEKQEESNKSDDDKEPSHVSNEDQEGSVNNQDKENVDNDSSNI